jgi:predicted PurR-regulated permease PerM
LNSSANRLTAVVVTISAVVALLVVGKALLLPLAVAVMIWYVIDAVSAAIARVSIGGRQPLRPVSLLLALAVIVLLLIGVSDMVGETVQQVREAAPGYQDNVLRMLDRLSALTGVEVAPAVQQFAGQINVGNAVGKIASGIMSLAGDAGLVAIYVLFLLIEKGLYDAKFEALFPGGAKARQARGIIEDIQRQIRQYLLIKTLVSALTGLVSYVVLMFVGVDYAAFWAFLIFLLNYIPTIGSLLGVAFPALLALVQFDTFTPFLILTVGLGTIQFLIGNVLEPRLMGSSLNLSPLVVILALSLWGQLWGVVGMFLSVPLTVIIMIVLSHFESGRPIAILLSQDGRIHRQQDVPETRT